MQAFLNSCQKIEVMAERVYRSFADNDQYPDTLRGAFLQLSLDESGHARQIDDLLRTELDPADFRPAISGTRLGEMVAKAEKLLKEGTEKNLTEEGALRRAISLEQEFLAVHLQHAVHFNNPGLEQFFRGLGQEDQRHIDYLKQLLAWWHAERRPKASG